jgi:ADP-dependent NAD(P)H-hydrate dehydratase / NAD(P)H-hydrate epimerase
VKPVLNPVESARLDAESTVPLTVLMERAGVAVAHAAVRMGAGYGTRVAVLVGPGNNGGDGYVAADHLRRRGVAVDLLALAPPRTEAAAWAAGRVGGSVEPLRPPDSRHDLVVDAVFGGGFRRGVPAALRPWMGLDVPVLAVDVPTGLDPSDGTVDEVAFNARRTITFHSLAPGHLIGEGPDRCGEVEIADIGLEGGSPEMWLVEADDADRPDRARTAHKWSVGSVLVMGGSEGMVGAAVFAARAALRFGAGAVGIASPSTAIAQVLAPEVLSFAAGEIPERFRVLVVGPGMGDDASALQAALASRRPLVIDADAIGLLPSDIRFDRPVVLTPHAGEFARMTGGAVGHRQAGALAVRTNSVVVLKGNPTFVTDGGVPRVVRSGGPSLATIGTGDVLSGMIAALLARGLPPLEAATSAAYWHGVAGTELAATTTLTADRLAEGVGAYAWDRP